MVEANRRHIRRLIQQGRSAGIIVVLTTQKPTSESIPTIIRDNCGLRVAFKVRKKEAATAILGDIDAEADPVQIPAGTPGRFVIEDEKLGAAIGQAYYISGADLAKITSLWSPVPDQSRVAEELARRAGISVTDEPEDAAMAPTPEPEVMEPVVEPETVETQPEPEVIEPLAASEPEPPPEPAVTVAEETDNTDDPFAGLL